MLVMEMETRDLVCLYRFSGPSERGPAESDPEFGRNVTTSGLCFCGPCSLLEFNWSSELDTSSECCSSLLEYIGRCRLMNCMMVVHGRGPILTNIAVGLCINALTWKCIPRSAQWSSGNGYPNRIEEATWHPFPLARSSADSGHR